MKESYPNPQSFNLPLCPMSATCARYFDEVEALHAQAAPNLSGVVGNAGDREQIALLQEHLRTCKTCQATMATLRKKRKQQRQALQQYLAEGEVAVPSTTASILAALRSEPQSLFPTTIDAVEEVNVPVAARPPIYIQKPQSAARRSRKSAGLAFALVAAAVLIVSSMQLFAHFAHQPGAQSSQVSSPGYAHKKVPEKTVPLSASVHKTTTWSSVVMTHFSADGKNMIVENYDPARKRSVPLVTAANTATVDSVSHAGDNLIYHIYNRNAQQTIYTFLSGEQYYFNGRGLNAVWSTDDSSVFLATNDGSLWKVDTKDRDKDPTRLAQTIQADKLAFYRNHFLYYMRAQGLYRINVDDDQSQEQQVVSQADSRVFWMDPISENIYYVKKNTAAQQDIYMHPGNTPPSADYVVQSNGTPIGYSRDAANTWSIVYVSWNQGTGGFDLKKTSSSEVLLSDIMGGQAKALCNNPPADGAICDNSLALSPTGRQLVVGGTNQAQVYQLWSIDLTSGTRTSLTVPAGQGPLQLIGWDKLLAN
ncbi:anti-sigma factor family protein [Dictyobacter aurantiacus]|uniref:Zinc-finger domain-containing protein n=1 Tax=Dictyobacter aurantiacus TaxID=1936993 RepID=A0A401Z7Y8_9CHLR|nr:hypothetical protein [Dictyobacter aurantiacus]GCE02977.1 hypothetical protein KDAU_03060 [Dictyobacter aurantiacus]